MANLEIRGEDRAGKTGLISFSAYSPMAHEDWIMRLSRNEGEVLINLGHRNGTYAGFWVSLADARQIARMMLETLADAQPHTQRMEGRG